MLKKITCITLCLFSLLGLVACGGQETPVQEEENIWMGEDMELEITMGMEDIPMADAPISTALMPVASGTKVYSNQNVVIDASHLDQGYVMIRYTGTNTARKKVIVTGPSQVKYTYDLKSDGQYETFPLSDGNGSYTIGVYQNVSDTKYSTLYSATVKATLNNEFAPFLLPNQYVNYTADSQVTKKAAELVSGQPDTLSKIKSIYEYVIKNITYDTAKAQSVKSGYLPDVDAILAAKKGICFDYAAVMASMLRSQGIPTKLVVGYAGKAYHAWINTWSQESGWVEGVIFFDGTTWKLMDPTFASSGNSSASIMKYIGDGSNYSAKYLY